MITKHYEITCDECGLSDYFPGTKSYAEREYIGTEGKISKGKHFCDKECLEEYNK